MKKVYFVAAVVLTLCYLGSTSYAVEKEWMRLFNGKNLEGWKLRNPDGRQSWSVVDGVLHNESTHDKGGTDICTVNKFGDCQLHIDFKVPKRGNSGVYLQGRYEVQVGDSHGSKRLSGGMCGAIYGKAVPSVNASKPAGEWQSYDIIFRQARRNASGEIVKKARITVVHNGKKIIDDVEIDGVTGGALDRNEGTPGPLMLQGDHSSVDYSNILIRPLGPKAVILKPVPPPRVLLRPIPPPPVIKPLRPRVIKPLPPKVIRPPRPRVIRPLPPKR